MDVTELFLQALTVIAYVVAMMYFLNGCRRAVPKREGHEYQPFRYFEFVLALAALASFLWHATAILFDVAGPKTRWQFWGTLMVFSAIASFLYFGYRIIIGGQHCRKRRK